MSKVERIEAALQHLSAVELQQVRDRLDLLVEDKLEFTPEFEADIQASEQEMRAGLRPRVDKGWETVEAAATAAQGPPSWDD